VLDLPVKQVLALQIELLDLIEALFRSASQAVKISTEIKRKSLILAQIERWRHALHMQVER
jgi:hypothetical protein